MAWVSQTVRGRVTPTVSGDKLEKHLCKGNMHLCCHICRFACKQIDYVESFGRNNLIVDCINVCERFELR